MASISEKEFHALLDDFERESIHVETRDAYGTETELPHIAKWSAGESDDFAWLDEYCTKLRAHVTAGRAVRRAMLVSEPLSDYHRWVYDLDPVLINAGEDIRWVPRRRVSSIGIPGNDFYLLDDRLIIFLHYAGNGTNTDFVTSTDPADIKLCRDAFAAVWTLGIPRHDYRPAETVTRPSD